jgi:O-acetylhomoserine/O-acetylserine sulfhydrylase-like pyridoxal-dependent enzyme
MIKPEAGANPLAKNQFHSCWKQQLSSKSANLGDARETLVHPIPAHHRNLIPSDGATVHAAVVPAAA